MVGNKMCLLTLLTLGVMVGGGLTMPAALDGIHGLEVLHGLEHNIGDHTDLYHNHDYHTKPEYAYKYGVNDPHTGDKKSAWEHRDGDTTKGGYTVVEPDGHTRVVEYIVTKKGGFQATVKRLPPHHG